MIRPNTAKITALGNKSLAESVFLLSFGFYYKNRRFYQRQRLRLPCKEALINRVSDGTGECRRDRASRGSGRASRGTSIGGRDSSDAAAAATAVAGLVEEVGEAGEVPPGLEEAGEVPPGLPDQLLAPLRLPRPRRRIDT